MSLLLNRVMFALGTHSELAPVSNATWNSCKIREDEKLHENGVKFDFKHFVDLWRCPDRDAAEELVPPPTRQLHSRHGIVTLLFPRPLLHLSMSAMCFGANCQQQLKLWKMFWGNFFKRMQLSTGSPCMSVPSRTVPPSEGCQWSNVSSSLHQRYSHKTFEFCEGGSDTGFANSNFFVRTVRFTPSVLQFRGKFNLRFLLQIILCLNSWVAEESVHQPAEHPTNLQQNLVTTLKKSSI